MWSTSDVFDPLPLQQGLRLRYNIIHNVIVAVFDPLPLQQGLRLLKCIWCVLCVISVFDPLPLQQGLRPDIAFLAATVEGLWPSSITTRIKTCGIVHWGLEFYRHVFDPLPLQQGLRHFCVIYLIIAVRGLWPSSITTRIKTGWAWAASGVATVFDPLPLQQGLRPLSDTL